MADQKISELTSLTSPAASDEFAVNDTSAATTKKLTYANLQNNITTVGTVTSGDVDAVVSNADLTTPGKIEIATVAETNTGTDATRAVSPDGLDGWTGSAQVTEVGTLSSGDATAVVDAASSTAAGKIELATDAETATGTATDRATTPANIASLNHITASSTDTLTNKTLDADGTGNSITNIEDANIKAAAAIDATKIADGTVTSTEFQYINSLSSNAQTQIDTKLANVVEDTTPQAGGDFDFQDFNVIGLGSVGFTQELDNGSKTASFSVDFSTDQKQKATLTANTITLTLDTTDIQVGNYILKLVNGGLATLTWAAETGSVLFPGGTDPSLTSSGTDIVTFYFDGTNFYGGSLLDFS